LRSFWGATLTLPPDGNLPAHDPWSRRCLSVGLPCRRASGAEPSGHDGSGRAGGHAAGRAFTSNLIPSLVFLAAVLITAAWIQVCVGLRPLDAVRRRLTQVRYGAAPRLWASFPDGVRPLAREVNYLIDA
jgi:hypothetical protein